MTENLVLKNVQHNFDIEVGYIGVTIRKGSKWADNLDLGLTDVILIECLKGHPGDCTSELGCVLRGKAQLLGYWYGQLKDIPIGLLLLEHEEKSRTPVGLKESLERAYGEVQDTELFTALIYLRTEKYSAECI